MEETDEHKTAGGSYSEAQVRDFEDQIRKLRSEAARLKFDLAHLAEQLIVVRAKTFAYQGLGRRMHSIERCVLNIFAIYPPNRREFLSHDECTDVGIQFQAFAMNVYALFDNVTWVCLLEAAQVLPPKSIGLFKKACRPFIPAHLRAYLDQPETERWFREYGTLYRDSTAHRIAPYLPTRTYTPAEGKRWQELHDESLRGSMTSGGAEQRADFESRLERIDRLEQEKAELGRNSLFMCLSLTGEDASPPDLFTFILNCYVTGDWRRRQSATSSRACERPTVGKRPTFRRWRSSTSGHFVLTFRCRGSALHGNSYADLVCRCGPPLHGGDPPVA